MRPKPRYQHGRHQASSSHHWLQSAYSQYRRPKSHRRSGSTIRPGALRRRRAAERVLAHSSPCPRRSTRTISSSLKICFWRSPDRKVQTRNIRVRRKIAKVLGTHTLALSVIENRWPKIFPPDASHGANKGSVIDRWRHTLRSAIRIMKESGAHSVKLEGGDDDGGGAVFAAASVVDVAWRLQYVRAEGGGSKLAMAALH